MSRAPRRCRPSSHPRTLGFLAAGAMLMAAIGLDGEPQTRSDPVVTSLTLFAGTPEGLWRSRDWGGTWQRAAGAGAEALEGAGAVRAIFPVGPQVYVGGEGGLFVSLDFGQSFKRESLSGPVQCVLLSRYPLADPTVFAGTPDGLQKSVDAGHTFRPTALKGTPVHRIEWPGPALVAATGRGVLVSLDGGASFGAPGSGLPPGDVIALALSSFYAADPVLFAGVASEGVYRSGDGARTWASAGLAGRRVSDLVWFGPLLYAATDQGVHKSEDNGKTWARLGDGLGARPATRLLFPLAPDVGAEVFVATEGGLFRSADGGQRWQPSGLAGQKVLSLATFPPPPRPVPKKRGRSS